MPSLDVSSILSEDLLPSVPRLRRFLSVEKILNSETYKYRVVVDDSYGSLLAVERCGCVGCRGVQSKQVDTVIHGNGVGIVGGFCAGSTEVIAHQRLSVQDTYSVRLNLRLPVQCRE